MGEATDFKDTEHREMAKNLLKKYFEGFKKRNPRLKVYNAVIHDDEASPHLHINFIPVGTNYKNGLESQVSFDRALKQDHEGINQTLPFKDWRSIETDHLENLLKELDIDRKYVGSLPFSNQKEFKVVRDLTRDIEVKKETLEKLNKEIEEKLEVSKMLPNVQELQSTISDIEENEKKLMLFIKKSENKPVNYQRTLEQLSSLDVSKDFLGRFKEKSVETITWIINVAKNAVKRVLLLEKRIESLETQLELKQNPVQEFKSQLSKLEELKKQVEQVEKLRVRTKQKNKDLNR